MNFIKTIILLSFSFSLNAGIVNFNGLVDKGIDSPNPLVGLEDPSFEAGPGLGGDLVGNGGGLAEKNILFSYYNLKAYIEICLSSPTCKIGTWEKDLLTKILKSLPQEQNKKEQIKFVSEKERPGFFRLDGELKLAKTGDNVGSPIYINSDLLYTKNSHGDFKAFSISDAVALLVHELGHHHGVKNHFKLDLLGIKVSMSLENHSDKASLFPHKKDFMAISINKRDAYQFPQLLVYFDNTFLDVSKEFKEALKCPGPFFHITSDKPHGANFHNMFWKKLTRRLNVYEFRLSGNVSTYCEGESYDPTQLRATTVEIKFGLKLISDEKKKSGYRWHFIEDSLRVKHFKKKWWRAFKMPDTGINIPFPL
jgi:hypothetical protein